MVENRRFWVQRFVSPKILRYVLFENGALFEKSHLTRLHEDERLRVWDDGKQTREPYLRTVLMKEALYTTLCILNIHVNDWTCLWKRNVM